MRRADVHLLPDSRAMGCEVQGPHVHVIRRENSNGAWAKSRRQRAVPVDFLVVQAFDQYELERQACRAATESDFVLVNLFRAPLGCRRTVEHQLAARAASLRPADPLGIDRALHRREPASHRPD